MSAFIFNDARVRESMGRIREAASQQQPDGSMRLLKNTLNGGELSPEMGARFDQQRFQTGAHTCLNMVPLPQGGVTRRPCLKSLARCKGAGATRIIPFVFSAAESRLLELYEKPGGVGLRVFVNPQTFHDISLTIPWASGALAEVSHAQSADVIYFAHPSFKPGKLMRYADNDWRYQEIVWLPSIQPPAITGISHSDTAGQSGAQVRNSYVATSIDAETGEESSPSAVASHTAYPLSSTFYNTITVSHVANASEYRIYKLKGGVYGFIGRITDGHAFEDRNIGADTEDTPPRWKDPFAGAGNYPALVFLHQQRLGFASSNSRPMTFYLSQTGNYESMASSVPPDADDAIEATLASSDASRIIWAESDRQGLAFGTGAGEWLLVSSDGAAITPQDLSFQPQTFYGSEKGLPVIRGGSTLLYAQKGSKAVREYGYSFAEDKYQSSDLTLLARHIIAEKKIRSWCWQMEPYGIVWLALSDGSLAGLTYLREHDVIAWHRHETRNGSVKQCAVIPGFVNQDTLCLVVERLNPETGGLELWLEYLDDFMRQESENDSVYAEPYKGVFTPCLPELQLESGMSFGLAKKINSITLQVINAYPMQAQVESQGEKPSRKTAVPQALPAASFTSQAIWHAPLAAGFRVNPKITLTLTKPGTILALSVNLEAAGLTGTKGK